MEDLARIRRVDSMYGLPDKRAEGVLGGLLAASGACKSAKDIERFLPGPPVPPSVALRNIKEIGRWLSVKTTAF